MLISNVIYVSINKQLIISQNFLALCLGFARGRVKRAFLISSASAGNILPTVTQSLAQPTCLNPFFLVDRIFLQRDGCEDGTASRLSANEIISVLFGSILLTGYPKGNCSVCGSSFRVACRTITVSTFVPVIDH